MKILGRTTTSLLGTAALVAGLVLATGTTASATGTAYFLDCSAGSAGAGTQASPWNSLSSANAHVFGPGDTLGLKTGTTCTGTLQPKGSGASGQPATITSYGGGAAPVVDGAGATSAVHLVDQSYWTISNLHIRNTASDRALRDGVLVESTGSAHKAGIVITGLEVSDTSGWGDKTGANASWFSASAGIVVKVVGGSGHFDGITITDNDIHDTGGGGIKLAGDTSTKHTAVYIARNTIDRAGGDGIVVHNSASPLVEHNTATDLGLGNYPFVAGNFAGMWPYNSSNPTFQYNTVGGSKPSTFDATAWDCDISVTGTCTYQYNYSYGNAGGFYLNCVSGCVFDPGSAGTSSTDVVLRYNVALDDCRLVLSSGTPGTHYIYNNTFYCPSRPIVDTIGNNKVMKNNIFVAPSGSFATGSGVVLDSNVYYGGIAAPAGDAHAVTTDPKLTGDPATAGLRLRSGSPALGSGAVVANNGGQDFFGNPVSATGAPNRGAYNGAAADEALPITSLYNEIGVTADNNATAGGLASATLSGRTFSGNALEAGGLAPGQRVTAGGVTFTWHPGRYGTPDNIHATGQTVAVGGTGSTLGIVGFATSNAPSAQGTLRFSDGSSQAFTLALTDWWNTTATNGNTLVRQVSYQNQHDAPYNDASTPAYGHTASLWLTKVALPAGKQLTSVTLPAGTGTSGTAQHIFAMAVAP
ncbi:right-handed parallel beta-helix repeat-containing protein [Kitasatospora sp. NPDC049258]|uniref:right-handed parallel beta-helix repeat-containing protein n=1 Tax=Kitasatospora sp. NPDC049258 TaxID=3155394 RepID=UPI003429487A